MKLTLLPVDSFSVVRFPTNVNFIQLVSEICTVTQDATDILSFTKTAVEISILLPSACVSRIGHHPDMKEERGFRSFKVEGPLDFSLVGILSHLTQPLAKNAISVFVVSTFDTDYILVKSENVSKTIELWTEQGHIVK